jgi:DNA-binding PadR family transcriptional regulator
MGQSGVADASSTPRVTRFELAAPRHFLFPAILLLLSESPGHGYALVKELRGFHFGPVDRPSVYRALAQLEGEGLVESWSEGSTAGQPRRVYGLTPHGERTLRVWMGVIKEERVCLDEVLRRYQATGTVDAALAEVEGQWGSIIGRGWSPVSSTSRARRRTTAVEEPTRTGDGRVDAGSAVRRTFAVVPDRSVLLIEARSTVGPISFGAIGLHGSIEAALHDGHLVADPAPEAHLEIPVEELRSGNSLYDAELLRRVDGRRYPTVSIELTGVTPTGIDDGYRLGGSVTFHGVTREAAGNATVRVNDAGTLVVAGEQVFDIRDFGLDSPTVLMLRIYPDVRVRLQLEAERVG